MHIQQLNDSGQPIWAFIVTAVILLLCTGSAWLFIERVNERRRKQNNTDEGIFLDTLSS